VFLQIKHWSHRYEEVLKFIDPHLIVELLDTMMVIHRAALT